VRLRLLACTLFLLWPTTGWAEWQIKPYIGFSFGTDTTFPDLEQEAENTHRVLGISGALLGEVFGVEGDLGRSSGFFGEQGTNVLSSSVTTFTGNVIVGLPRKWTRYTLRPYIVGGGGAMRLVVNHQRISLIDVDKTVKVLNVGGGATGFLTNRVGVSWELRYFRSFGTEQEGVSFGQEELSFYRATMALVIGLDRRFQ
jgi:Outer membrane protein beta-barrel domain